MQMTEYEPSTILVNEPRLIRGNLRIILGIALGRHLPVVIRNSQLAKLQTYAMGFSGKDLGIAEISVQRADSESDMDYISKTANALQEAQLKISPIKISGTNDGDELILNVFKSVDGLNALSSERILRALFSLLKGPSLLPNTVMVIVLPDKEKKKAERKIKPLRSMATPVDSGSQVG